jgi:hypothetical protein
MSLQLISVTENCIIMQQKVCQLNKANVRFWPNADMSVNDPKRTLANIN